MGCINIMHLHDQISRKNLVLDARPHAQPEATQMLPHFPKSISTSLTMSPNVFGRLQGPVSLVHTTDIKREWVFSRITLGRHPAHGLAFVAQPRQRHDTHQRPCPHAYEGRPTLNAACRACPPVVLAATAAIDGGVRIVS